MPTYTYRCDCGRSEDHYRKVDDRNVMPECHGPMRRVISAPMVFVKPECHYQSPIDGRPITSRQARADDMARANCIEYDPEMRTDYQRRIKDSETRLEREVDSTVDAVIAGMPARKRERLEAELAGGMSVEPERRTAPAKPIVTEIAHG